MRRRYLVPVATLFAAAFLSVACAQAVPAPAAPTKAPEPAKSSPAQPAATAQPTTAAQPAAPTAAPEKKVDFPTKGKAITLSVGYPPGGANDIGARLLAPVMEKALGVPVQVVNKPGAGSQVELTEVAAAKPDGYLIGQTVLAPAITAYLDPERKATFTRKSFQMLGNHYAFPIAVSVSADSPYKTLKDVVDAAKAKPGSVKIGSTGILSNTHLAGLQLQKLIGAKLSYVQFDGGAPELTALLGGHIDVSVNPVTEVVSQFKDGKIRVLGITDKDEVPLLAGVKTLDSQGYPIMISGTTGYVLPANTPKDVLDVLSTALKKSVADPDLQKKLVDQAYLIKYMDPQQYDAYWAELEKTVEPLLPLAKE
ncbi:MAG TPA: tripartite tricarboxylate transporter substrate binding protein [Chloroflexota bacterium]